MSAPTAQRRRRSTWPTALFALAAAAMLFGLFHVGTWSSVEDLTPEMAKVHPERVFRWWVQRGDKDDPRLYFELTSQILGKPYDRALLEYKRGRVELSDSSEMVQPSGPARPYADVKCEYPPLALALFLAPRLFTDDSRAYSHLFSVEMGLVIVGLGLILFRLRRRLRSASEPEDVALSTARLFALAVLFWGMTQVMRFDAAPALSTGGALLALLAGAPGWAGALLGVGAALKLWPVLLGPLFLLVPLLDGDRRGAAKMIAAGAAVVAAAHAPMVAIAGEHAFDYLKYQGGRGLHTESLLGNTLVLLSKLTPLRVWTRFENGSDAVHAAGIFDRAFVLTHFALPLSILAALAAAARGVRRTVPSSVPRGVVLTAAVVSLTGAMLVTSKVFSPQYLIWLAPAALALPGRDGRIIAAQYLFACLLTQVFYPRAYMLISDLTLLGHTILFIRNVTLAVMAVRAGRLALGAAADAEPLAAHA